MTGFVRELTLSYRKTATAEPHIGKTMNCPELVAALVNDLIGDSAQERFIAIHLDVRNRLRSFQTVGLGGVSGCPVSAAEVFKGALMANAVGIVIAHNHPSGDSTPSSQDDMLTHRLVKAGDLLGLSIIDHVIVAGDGCEFYSYAQHERLVA